MVEPVFDGRFSGRASLPLRAWGSIALLGCALLLQLWPGRVMIISQAGLALFAVTLALGAWRAGRRRSQQLDALATDHREDRADLP